MTSITLSTQYGTYTISIGKEDMNMEDVMGELIRPLLLAAGYHSETISEYIEQ